MIGPCFTDVDYPEDNDQMITNFQNNHKIIEFKKTKKVEDKFSMQKNCRRKKNKVEGRLVCEKK